MTQEQSGRGDEEGEVGEDLPGLEPEGCRDKANSSRPRRP